MLAALLVLPERGITQAPQAVDSLTVAGRSGQIPVIQVAGKSYVEVEALARLTNGSLSFRPKQIALTLPAPVPAPPTDQPAKPGFSTEFLKASIEAMTVIREWRIAIVRAVQGNSPVTESWVGDYRRAAASKLTLASGVVATDADRDGIPLLINMFNNMKKLSDTYLELNQSLTYIDPDSIENNPLEQQILSCGRGLASLAASGQFQDVPSCH